jgi:hypothetical protein
MLDELTKEIIQGYHESGDRTFEQALPHFSISEDERQAAEDYWDKLDAGKDIREGY